MEATRELPVVEPIHEFQVGRSVWEVPVMDPVHEFEVGPSAWELPVGTRVVPKWGRGKFIEMHG